MVKQGDIIKISFDPQKGHEQAGYRPALVVSSDYFNSITGFVIVCPITNTDNKFPLHIPLDDRTITTGVIMCEHLRSLDLNARPYKITENVPNDIMEKVQNYIAAIINI